MRTAFTALAGLAALAATAEASPLYDFVHATTAYNWTDTGFRLNEIGWDGYLLNVTSGYWLTPGDSDRYLWWHQVLVVVPWNVNFYDAASMWITGGDNNSGNPGAWDEDVLICASLATNAGTPCSVVYQIPNQPIIFPADPIHKSRSEDDAVAFTWKTYMLNETASPDWIIYLPMARGAIKAMDATTEFVKTLDKRYTLDRWMLMGGSKRGWTTWFAGSVDKRVIGIAPCVMDLLNFQKGIQAMWQSLGNWTFAFEPYLAEGITSYFGTPVIDRLAKIIDPINYAANLTMSKLVIDATGDEFFEIQDDHFWWGDLPGESLRMMVQNAEHSLATGALEVITGVEAWWWALLTNTPRPQFKWAISPTDGSITVQVFGKQQPTSVVMRYATTLDGYRRDFRLISGDTPADPCKYIPVHVFGTACLRPIIWFGESLKETAPGVYVLSQPEPEVGWRAFIAELYFDGPQGTNTTYKLTTQASIVPNTYPFPPCYGESCTGSLV